MNNPVIAKARISRTAPVAKPGGIVQPPAPQQSTIRADATSSNIPTPTPGAQISRRPDIKELTLCHFSTAHSALKSRSYHRECLPLAAAGAPVSYVSPAPVQGSRHGIEFVRVSQSTSRLRRVIAGVALVKSLLAQQAQIYHFQDPELMPAAFALKLAARKRVIYDAYEDFPSMARQSKTTPRILRPLAARAVAGIENLAARCFDGVMTADPLTMQRFARIGGSEKLVFYNFPNLDFFPAPKEGRKIFDIVYRGGIADRAGTAVLLAALCQLLKDGRRLRLLLLGYFDNLGAEVALREQIGRMGLTPSIELRGRIDHEQMAETLSLARIGVSPLQDVPKFRINIPVKIFEYWACMLPVITSDLPPIRPFFRNAHAGLVFPPGDVESLSRCIGWMIDHPAEANGMGKRGRTIVEQRLNNEMESRKFREFCLRVAQQDRKTPKRTRA